MSTSVQTIKGDKWRLYRRQYRAANQERIRGYYEKEQERERRRLYAIRYRALNKEKIQDYKRRIKLQKKVAKLSDKEQQSAQALLALPEAVAVPVIRPIPMRAYTQYVSLPVLKW